MLFKVTLGRSSWSAYAGRSPMRVIVIPEPVLHWSREIASALGVGELGISGPFDYVLEGGGKVFHLWLVDEDGKSLLPKSAYVQADDAAGHLAHFEVRGLAPLELHWYLPPLRGFEGCGYGGGADLPAQVRTLVGHYLPVLRSSR